MVLPSSYSRFFALRFERGSLVPRVSCIEICNQRQCLRRPRWQRRNLRFEHESLSPWVRWRRSWGSDGWLELGELKNEWEGSGKRRKGREKYFFFFNFIFLLFFNTHVAMLHLVIIHVDATSLLNKGSNGNLIDVWKYSRIITLGTKLERKKLYI